MADQQGRTCMPHLKVARSTGIRAYDFFFVAAAARVKRLLVLGKSVVLLIVNVGSAEPPTVLRRDVSGALPDWSPTGEWISFQDEGGWNVISPDGKTIKALGKISTQHLAFSKDSKQLFGVREEHTNATLFSLDLVTSQIKDLRDLGHELSQHRTMAQASGLA